MQGERDRSELTRRARDPNAIPANARIVPNSSLPDGALVRELMIVNRKGLHARATANWCDASMVSTPP